MNPRIRELAADARGQMAVLTTVDEQAWKQHEEFVKKFAELIVRECGQVLVDNTPVVDLVEDWDKGYDRAMNDCIHHIYEHFGVEE